MVTRRCHIVVARLYNVLGRASESSVAAVAIGLFGPRRRTVTGRRSTTITRALRFVVALPRPSQPFRPTVPPRVPTRTLDAHANNQSFLPRDVVSVFPCAHFIKNQVAQRTSVDASHTAITCRTHRSAATAAANPHDRRRHCPVSGQPPHSVVDKRCSKRPSIYKSRYEHTHVNPEPQRIRWVYISLLHGYSDILPGELLFLCSTYFPFAPAPPSHVPWFFFFFCDRFNERTGVVLGTVCNLGSWVLHDIVSPTTRTKIQVNLFFFTTANIHVQPFNTATSNRIIIHSIFLWCVQDVRFCCLLWWKFFCGYRYEIHDLKIVLFLSRPKSTVFFILLFLDPYILVQGSTLC